MSIIKAENLYKTYGDKTLFDHISFHIEENERIGLIGPNGTGKSTLLKTIAGLESTEEGEITASGNVHIEFCIRTLSFRPDKPYLSIFIPADQPS